MPLMHERPIPRDSARWHLIRGVQHARTQAERKRGDAMMNGWDMNGWGWTGMTLMMAIGVLLVALLVMVVLRGRR